jgi:hypothetical protein
MREQRTITIFSRQFANWISFRDLPQNYFAELPCYCSGIFRKFSVMLNLCTFAGVNPSEYAHLRSNQSILDMARNKSSSRSEAACRDSEEIDYPSSIELMLLNIEFLRLKGLYLQ